jgi:predicted RNase H-like HicB family nuclease
LLSAFTDPRSVERCHLDFANIDFRASGNSFRDRIRAVEESARSGVYEVLAQWDGDAGVWVAESDDVPGLVAEATSPEILAQKLKILIPELLELNGPVPDRSASFHVLYQHEDSGVLTF